VSTEPCTFPFVQHHPLTSTRSRSGSPNTTVREFLYELIDALNIQEWDFSGKRPFGNADWKIDMCHALAFAGFIPNNLTKDEDGDIEGKYDKIAADTFITNLLKHIFFTPKP
jgi:hypothetical protein